MSCALSGRICALLAAACSFIALSTDAVAGARPQVDLSVSVMTTPEPFVPGGIVTATMTVRNDGPETAGATLPNQNSIIVYEKGYDITTQPPPYVLFEPGVGCSAYAEESEPIFPGPHIFFGFSYWFGPIGPGDSRTCTYRLQLDPSTRENFATYWIVHTPNDDDINPENNRFDYTFVAAPSQASIPVPTLSAISLLILSAGLLFAVASARSRGQLSFRHTSPNKLATP
jgi:hypothetical protein